MPRYKKASLFFGLILGIALLFSSCGYRWGQGGSLACYRTITIPYVEGDWNGELTAAIIREISQTGTFSYLPCGGQLTLYVTIIDIRDENIGFQYDRTKSGRTKRSVVPDETRLIALAEVTVVEALSGESLLGPARITAYVDYDHDYYNTRDGINVFSLGQLTDIDTAEEEAHRPLNNELARKIADFVNAS